MPAIGHQTSVHTVVDAGEIEFVVRNDGERLHAFAVETGDGIERTKDIKPGETERVTVDLTAGRYRCTTRAGDTGREASAARSS